MQKIAVCVSGGGTNLQAIIDAVSDGTIRNTEIAVVISNKENAYALERASKAGIPARCISPKSYESRDSFADAMLDTLEEYEKKDNRIKVFHRKENGPVRFPACVRGEKGQQN